MIVCPPYAVIRMLDGCRFVGMPSCVTWQWGDIVLYVVSEYDVSFCACVKLANELVRALWRLKFQLH